MVHSAVGRCIYPDMSRWLKLILIGLCLTVLLLGIGYFCLATLTPSLGTIVAYADQQPPLRIVQPSNASGTAEVERMGQLAKLHFQNMRNLDELYWPEPSLIEEHDSCWLIAFTTKRPVYRFLWHDEIVQPTDHAMYLSIAKSDYTTRCGRWCN